MKYIILSVYYCNSLATPLLGQTTNGSDDTVVKNVVLWNVMIDSTLMNCS